MGVNGARVWLHANFEGDDLKMMSQALKRARADAARS